MNLKYMRSFMNKVTKQIRVLYRIYPGKKQGAECRCVWANVRANVRISALARILMKFWMYLRTRTIKNSAIIAHHM